MRCEEKSTALEQDKNTQKDTRTSSKIKMLAEERKEEFRGGKAAYLCEGIRRATEQR